jgi:ABC-2 type transport system ATP-binding protein
MSRHVLEVDRLKKVYRTSRKAGITAVDDVSLTVGTHEIVGLLGANGAGKTTTIKCICNLIRPTAGRVSVRGHDSGSSARAVYSRISAVLEGNRNIYWRLTPRENLEFFAGLQGIPMREARPAATGLLEAFGLTAKVNTPARMLSRGMQQKLALACAMIKGTELLVLDEPTLGLDVRMSHELRTSLRELGARGQRSILLSSHDMQVVQSICDRVVIIHGGRVVADDRVERLLEAFRSRSYRVVVDGVLDADARARVSRAFAAARTEDEGERTRIDVEVGDPRRLYDLVELLRGADALIHSIGTREPTLEEVFLTMTDAGRNP